MSTPLVRALVATGVLLLLIGLLFAPVLPWWANALTLAGAVIASLEAVHQARKAGAR